MRGGREKPFIGSSIRTVDDQTTAACGRISPSSTKERERLIHFRRWLARPPAWPRTKVGELLARPLSVLTPRGRHESRTRSEEHTSELQSRPHLVCRLLLEKKKKGFERTS